MIKKEIVGGKTMNKTFLVKTFLMGVIFMIPITTICLLWVTANQHVAAEPLTPMRAVLGCAIGLLLGGVWFVYEVKQI